MKAKSYKLLFFFVLWFSTKLGAQENLELAAQCLLKAYPDFFCSYQNGALFDCSGKTWPFREGGFQEKKELRERLKDPSLIDTFVFKYPKGRDVKWPLPKDFDPGRFRYEKFFKAVYGANSSEVRNNVVAVSWLPKFTNKKIWVTKIGNVAQKLKKVSDAIEKLPAHIRERVYNPQGGFNWRFVRGTHRLSAHSFGIAIDLFSPSATSYWKFSKPDKRGLYQYKNNFPLEIVEIFEKYGFIWGGKWYHFDPIHFEYRPELLVEECL